MSAELAEPVGAQGLLSASSESLAVDALLVSSTDEAPDGRARPERARAALLSLQLRTAEHEAAAAERAEQAWNDGGAYELLKSRLDALVQRRREELAVELEQARLDAARGAAIRRAAEVGGLEPAVAETPPAVAATPPAAPETPPAAPETPAAAPEISVSLPPVDVDHLARAIAREIVEVLPAARRERPPRTRADRGVEAGQRAPRDEADARPAAGASRPQRASRTRADRTRADRAPEPVRRTSRDELDDSPAVTSQPRRAPRTRADRTRADRTRADRTRGTEERAPRARVDSRPAGAPTRPQRTPRSRPDRGETVVEQTPAPARPPAQPLPARAPLWRQLLHLDVALPLIAVLVVVVVLLAWVG